MNTHTSYYTHYITHNQFDVTKMNSAFSVAHVRFPRKNMSPYTSLETARKHAQQGFCEGETSSSYSVLTMNCVGMGNCTGTSTYVGTSTEEAPPFKRTQKNSLECRASYLFILALAFNGMVP
jgi:hypothetical protein